jgi:hypothetical protein
MYDLSSLFLLHLNKIHTFRYKPVVVVSISVRLVWLTYKYVTLLITSSLSIISFLKNSQSNEIGRLVSSFERLEPFDEFL